MSAFQIEIFIYLVLIIILGAIQRVISGLKNATFYAKGQANPAPKLQKYINNYHFLETPNWYSTYGMVFLFFWIISRFLHPRFELCTTSIQLLAVYLVAMGTSGLGNYWYQGYINLGAGRPFEDPNENPKSEFALGSIKFWWPRPWGGKRRKYIVLISAISISIGLYLIMK
jgi:hypothetical protein